MALYGSELRQQSQEGAPDPNTNQRDDKSYLVQIKISYDQSLTPRIIADSIMQAKTLLCY
jgi:hypothetical protein